LLNSGENTYWKLDKCGRPLGMRVKDDYLYVLEAKSGLFRINLITLKIQHLIKDIELYEKSATIFFNSFVFDPIDEDRMYISITSLRYNVDRVPYSLFEHESSGKVITFALKSGQIDQIASDLHFANGLEISSSHRWLFIAQTTASEINRLDLDQLRRHLLRPNIVALPKVQTFTGPLPGEPDNIVAYGDKLLVGFAVARTDGKLLPGDYLAAYPRVRRYILSLLSLASWPFKVLSNVSSAFEKIAFDLWSGYSIYNLAPAKGAFALVDQESGAIDVLYDLSGIAFVSEAAAIPGTDAILIGSFCNRFIGLIRGFKK
jgi:hypothetical protein